MFLHEANRADLQSALTERGEEYILLEVLARNDQKETGRGEESSAGRKMPDWPQ